MRSSPRTCEQRVKRLIEILKGTETSKDRLWRLMEPDEKKRLQGGPVSDWVVVQTRKPQAVIPMHFTRAFEMNFIVGLLQVVFKGFKQELCCKNSNK